MPKFEKNQGFLKKTHRIPPADKATPKAQPKPKAMKRFGIRYHWKTWQPTKFFHGWYGTAKQRDQAFLAAKSNRYYTDVEKVER